MSQHLKIALEPEAASLFCQYLPVEKFSIGGQVSFSDAKPGTTYMIVDLGGKQDPRIKLIEVKTTVDNIRNTVTSKKEQYIVL